MNRTAALPSLSPRATLLLAVALCLGTTSATARAQDPAPPAAPAPEAAPQAPPAEAPVSPALEARLEEINQRALIAERKLELIEEDLAKAKATAPVLAAGEKGFNWKSPDGLFVLKVRGYIQADGREYLDSTDANPINQRNTFVMRRVRPVLEATFFDVADFRLMPDFGGGAATLFDAYIDLRPFPWLKLRAGKFKPPVGLERLQSATAILFPERAFPTALVPSRDVGVQLHGVVGAQLFTYELGLFNGVVDGGNGDADTNYAKDAIGRLFFTPWKSDPYSFLANLGLGVAASIGGQRGTPAVLPPARAANSVPNLPGFRSGGQQTIFSYIVNDNAADSTVIGRGRRTRISPQGYFYYDAFGVLGEWVQSSQSVVKGANITTLDHRAWQVAASYIFGGKNAFEGATVTKPFQPKTGDLGAFEIGARYNALEIDDDTFPTYASLASSAKKAQAFGVVLNWHWSKNIKLAGSYERTKFTGGPGADGNRPTEHVIIERVQAAF